MGQQCARERNLCRGEPSSSGGCRVDERAVRGAIPEALRRDTAAHSGAAIIPGFALWSDDESRYILKFYPPIHATGDADADTRALHAHLESVIRDYPDQWLWMHRRWKTRPPGAPPLY